MDDFLKMDVFFVVATLALVVVSVMIAVFLFYAIRVVRTADRLGTLVEKEFALIKGDIDDARLAAKREAGQLLALISTVRKIAARFIAPRAPRDE
jgi:uncharacterized membrane protein YqiK